MPPPYGDGGIITDVTRNVSNGWPWWRSIAELAVEVCRQVKLCINVRATREPRCVGNINIQCTGFALSFVE